MTLFRIERGQKGWLLERAGVLIVGVLFVCVVTYLMLGIGAEMLLTTR